MQFFALVAFVALPAAILANPVVREPSVNCGGTYYSGSQVATCVSNADNDAAPSTT